MDTALHKVAQRDSLNIFEMQLLIQ